MVPARIMPHLSLLVVRLPLVRLVVGWMRGWCGSGLA
ncbi:hypothetical protein Ae150APs1_6136 [Pseudonocardia sp. Ae150A_Ps1]|nr:hypothetical protein Ae150APs1_6136 [Pseudonocardia sp. Ae150A_Ps1]